MSHDSNQLVARAGAIIMTLSLATAGANAQMLLSNRAPLPVDATGQPDPLAHLRAVSLLLVEAPKPRSYSIHDKLTIIISETSRQSSSQTLDTKKDANFKAALNKFPDLMKLLEAQLEDVTGAAPLASADVTHNTKWKGEGKYDRADKFTDRITATVIDVKPNGVLVLEARRIIQKDDEKTIVTLTGECRRDDVTEQNTVLSSQLAEMTLITRNEGRVREAAKKGYIPRLLEALFNF